MIKEVIPGILFHVKIKNSTYKIEIQERRGFNNTIYFLVDPISLCYKWRFWDKYSHCYSVGYKAKELFPDSFDGDNSRYYSPAFKDRESAIKFLYYMDRRYNPNFNSKSSGFIDFLRLAI